MSWSLRLGTFAGTEVRVHITFWLLLIWIWFMHYLIGGAEAAWFGVVFILAVFLCVVLHEFGHALAARRYGIRTPDITLLPIGGLARLERMPEEPHQELVIAIAGPAVNVVIAASLMLYLGGWVGYEELMRIEDPREGFLARLAAVNLFLVLFNLIPAFPMDGGRVLRAMLATRLSWPRATQIAASIGQGFAFLLGFVGLFLNPILIFIAIFVYLAAAAEAQNAQIREVSRSVLVGDVMITDFARLSRRDRIDDAIEALMRTTQREFPVVDAGGRLEGLLTRDDIIHALKSKGPDALLLDAMRTEVPLVHHRKCLEDAFRMMQTGETPALGVVDSAGKLVGLVTHEVIGEMMMVRSARPEGFRFRRWRRSAHLGS